MKAQSRLTRLEREAAKRRPVDVQLLVVLPDANGAVDVTDEQAAYARRVGVPVIILDR